MHISDYIALQLVYIVLSTRSVDHVREHTMRLCWSIYILRVPSNYHILWLAHFVSVRSTTSPLRPLASTSNISLFIFFYTRSTYVCCYSSCIILFYFYFYFYTCDDLSPLPSVAALFLDLAIPGVALRCHISPSSRNQESSSHEKHYRGVGREERAVVEKGRKEYVCCMANTPCFYTPCLSTWYYYHMLGHLRGARAGHLYYYNP
jgi:hypothetical protein